MDQLAEAHVTALAFSGGEPITRKDFFQVARYASDKGLYISLASNGTLLTKENAVKLKEAGVNYVDISIDGATAKTHDDFRGVPGAYDKAVAGLKNCVEADICACIATTVGKNNMAELPAIIDLAEQLHVERFTYFNFIPAGRGKDHADQDLSPQEREEVMRYLLNRMSAGCKTTILATAPQLARVAAQCQGDNGHRRSHHGTSAHANSKSHQKSRTTRRIYRRMRSWADYTAPFPPKATYAPACSYPST